MVKYLARYLTGGPISDGRLTNVDDRSVAFSARTGRLHGGSDETEDVELPVLEFVRRWCLHILPKGFTKSRRFGGWSNHHRERYVAQCRALCGIGSDGSDEQPDALLPDGDFVGRPCPTCGHSLERLEHVHRTSWRDIFASDSCLAWYRIRERGG